ncbi:hypothetical protein MRB53_014942 [Persea americana]|uniref:Uncharacterized protein n=1 Tax=Persea americana TaxID=3435 RepID=A0ACC2KCL6_PERAE|nr:hypothetical protein MRB53_014942 [Persea americana]
MSSNAKRQIRSAVVQLSINLTLNFGTFLPYYYSSRTSAILGFSVRPPSVVEILHCALFHRMSLNLSSNNFVTTEPELHHTIEDCNCSLQKSLDQMIIWLLELAQICRHFSMQSFGFHECQLQWPIEIQDGVNAMSATVKIQRLWSP